jgi:hypothetical protein
VHEAIQHLILLVFSAGLSAIGWFMAHNPVRVYQAFNWVEHNSANHSSLVFAELWDGFLQSRSPQGGCYRQRFWFTL